MPVTTRLPAAARRSQILDAAKGIVVDRGFHAISIEAVCRAAGVTRPVVYTHFGDLPGLLDALVDRETARALEQLGAVLPQVLGTGDPRQRLLAAFEAYLRTAERDPDTWRLVLMPPEGAPPRMGTAITQTREAVIGMLTDALRGGPPDPALVARWMDTIADESARLLLTRPAEYPVERAVAGARWLLERLS